ncbi:MAG: S1 RNA-binding domain-containing protein [Ghiorsea sp.]
MSTEVKPDDNIEQEVQSTVANEEESFADLFEASLVEQPKLSRGSYVSGVVVAIDTEYVTVDLQGNAEGVIAISEFVTIGQDVPAIGDAIDALMTGKGRMGAELSVLQAKRRKLMEEMVAAKEAGKTVSATVTKEVKGGFRVDLGGLEAFMPRSEADTGFVNADDLVGNAYEVAVIEVQHRPENVVVSRKQPIAAVEEVQRAKFFETAEVGGKVSGTVKRLTNFGAFVDLGGLDALLHVSDIAWKHIDNPAEMLSVGQAVKAEIIKLDAKAGKLSISMKNLIEDPWTSVAETYESGMQVTGTVRKLIKVGAIVELEPGVDGLVHRSEMSWTRKDIDPSKVLSEGDVVDVAVIDFDAKERRLRLSLKAVRENPWQVWMADHPAGSKLTGKIRNISEFGFFVGLTEELDGLVHIGNLSWDVQGDEAIKAYSKGQEVECVVIGVDVERQRIALGIKQLTANPFDTFMAGAKRGTAVNGKVVEVLPNACLVEVAEGIVGRLAFREIPREQTNPAVGDEIEAKITKVEQKRQRIELSIRQLLHDEERDSMRMYADQVKQEAAPSALALELQRKLLGKK